MTLGSENWSLNTWQLHKRREAMNIGAAARV
jgi:hypothetical protein